MGFKKIGRHFYKYPYYVEIPKERLQGEKTTILKYRNKKIRVISVEDLIIDRRCACKFWKSTYDCEQAKMLERAYKKKINWNYLNRRAEEENVPTQN